MVFRVELGGGAEGRKVSRDRAAELCKDRSFTALWAIVSLSIFIRKVLECIAFPCRNISLIGVYRMNWRGQNGCRETGQ